MLITIKEKSTVEKTVEIKTPCYLYEPAFDRHHFINENGDMITVGNNILVLWSAEVEDTKKQIASVFKDSHGCIEADFKDALERVLFITKETYTS
jgi:hypothetical protein